MEDDHNKTIQTPPRSLRSHTPLVIAVVVSAMFFLAALAIGIWLAMKPGGTTSFLVPTGDGSDMVKSVSFLPASTLTPAYVRRDQNILTSQSTYYYDAAAGCGIATHVMPAKEGSAPKDTVIESIKSAQTYGTTVTSTADSEDVRIKDDDKEHTYNFASIQLAQTLAVPGVPYTAQHMEAAFKQFGASIASIHSWCKADAWEAKKAELKTFVSEFIVKTEK